MSTYIEDAVVVVDNESECRITVEPGYTDDRDRECLRMTLRVKDREGEMRLPYSEVLPLATKLVSLAMNRTVKLAVKRVKR